MVGVWMCSCVCVLVSVGVWLGMGLCLFITKPNRFREEDFIHLPQELIECAAGLSVRYIYFSN